jgi:hypothetical protein
MAIWYSEVDDELETRESYKVDWKTPFRRGRLLGKLIASPFAKVLKLLTPDQAGFIPFGVPL